MPLRFYAEQESASVHSSIEPREQEHPTTLLSSGSIDATTGAVVGAIPVALFVAGNSFLLRWAPLCIFGSALLLLVLCVLYFLPLRPYRALRLGLMVGLSLFAVGVGLWALIVNVARIVPRLAEALQSLGVYVVPSLGADIAVPIIVGLALLGLAAAIVRAGLRREPRP